MKTKWNEENGRFSLRALLKVESIFCVFFVLWHQPQQEVKLKWPPGSDPASVGNPVFRIEKPDWDRNRRVGSSPKRSNVTGNNFEGSQLTMFVEFDLFGVFLTIFGFFWSFLGLFSIKLKIFQNIWQLFYLLLCSFVHSYYLHLMSHYRVKFQSKLKWILMKHLPKTLNN